MATTTQVTLDDLNSKTFVTGFARQLEFPQFVLGQFFPEERIGGIRYSWNSTPNYQEPAVRYRAWDQPTEVGKRPGVTRASAELPPLGKKKIMTEEHAIRLEALAAGDWGPYIAAAFDDITNLTEGVQARWELDRAALLSTGQLTVAGADRGDGTQEWTQTIDYAIPGGNIVTASPLWSSTTTADPILDITTWVNAYRVLNRGVTPGVMLTPRAVLNYLLRNSALRSLLYFGAANTAPSVLPVQALNLELQSRGLPTIVVVDEQLTASDGTFGYALPQNKVILLPDPNTGIYVGRTIHGLTAEGTALLGAGEFTTTTDAAGIVAQSYVEEDPASRYNRVNATGMPVISNPSLLMIGTVA